MLGFPPLQSVVIGNAAFISLVFVLEPNKRVTWPLQQDCRVSLVLVAYDLHPRYRLIAACNRDEYHFRETLPADWWEDMPDVLGGRDIETGGTWFGVRSDGRFSAITGYLIRSPPVKGGAPAA